MKETLLTSAKFTELAKRYPTAVLLSDEPVVAIIKLNNDQLYHFNSETWIPITESTAQQLLTNYGLEHLTQELINKSLVTTTNQNSN